MSLLRPNKADIEKYKQAIKDYKTAKVTGPDCIRDYRQAWKALSSNHFSKLNLDLKHISDRPIKDSLEADAIEGETLFNTESFFRHYTDTELSIIATDLYLAKIGLKHIEKKLKAEQDKRNKHTPTKLSRVSKLTNIE